MMITVLQCALIAMATWRTPPQPPPDVVPDLDDLLGVDEDKSTDDQDADTEKPQDGGEGELGRKLSGEELGEAFAQAVRMMGDAAEKLESADAGLDTQRLQERIIKRLEMIIASAPRNQQPSSSAPSSSSSQSPQSSPQQQQQQASAQPGQAGQPGANAQGGSPPLQEGPLAPEPGLGTALWGALPQRVRESISQGAANHFSTLYEELTAAYYRRLAEEAEDQ